MSKRTRAQRRAEKRSQARAATTRAQRKADRRERAKPPPEALAHLKPWPMQLLLEAGPDGGGIDADEFEAALQIVETYRVLVADMDLSGSASGEARGVKGPWWTRNPMSDRDAARCAVWFAWSDHLPKGLPPRLVAWIEDDEPIGSVVVLRRACRMWDKTRADLQRVDKTAPNVLTIPPPELCQSGQFDGRAVNLPATVVSLPGGPFPHPTPHTLLAAFGSQPSVVLRANPSTPTPAARFRRS